MVEVSAEPVRKELVSPNARSGAGAAASEEGGARVVVLGSETAAVGAGVGAGAGVEA